MPIKNQTTRSEGLALLVRYLKEPYQWWIILRLPVVVLEFVPCKSLLLSSNFPWLIILDCFVYISGLLFIICTQQTSESLRYEKDFERWTRFHPQKTMLLKMFRIRIYTVVFFRTSGLGGRFPRDQHMFVGQHQQPQPLLHVACKMITKPTDQYQSVLIRETYASLVLHTLSCNI